MNITQQSEIRRDIPPILIFALTLFSSASLMFVLQPMFGKALLPLLGGAASVWNTCMVFYQSLLFVGYLYAHLISTRLEHRQHLLIHIAVLAISLYFLPVDIPENSRPPTTEDPSIWLLKTLFSSIGLPFFILSTSSPLLQKWFSRLGHRTSNDPYYLSIASNAGSLIALLSYPFLLEPNFGISLQQQYWSIGFLVLIALISICMALLKQYPAQLAINDHSPSTPLRKADFKTQLRWLVLAFVPSSLLLGTTNFISIDIATVPLLWVIPLALYLLSFILVFSRYGNKIHKKLFLVHPWVTVSFLIYYFSGQKLASFTLELLFHLLVFFISIMVCHGELAKKRPSTHYLTQYYLVMSFGGMLGGIFNSFIAPFLFTSIYEYPLMIVCALLLNPIHRRMRLYLKVNLERIVCTTYILTFVAVTIANAKQFGNVFLIGFAAIVLLGTAYVFFKRNALYFPLFGLLVVSCAAPEKPNGEQLLHQSRNFYGVLSVKKMTDFAVENDLGSVHEIYSGTTKHGLQLIDDSQRQCVPNGYYSPQGPLGAIFSSYANLDSDWRIGVVGLGAGEMAGYAKPLQHWTFYELNPAVVDLATDAAYFTYLTECIDNYDVQIGDARITLEKRSHQYDLLVIDAFTSDSIPTHLLTKEAIQLYFARLSEHGLLVFHISNRYLELKKVLADHAEKLGLAMRYQEFRPKLKNPLIYKSDWAILTRSGKDLGPLLNTESSGNWQKTPHYTDTRSWTDDFTSIMNVWK